MFVDVARQDVRVHLLHKFLNSSQHPFVNRVRIWIRLDFLEHGVVLFPVVVEADIVFDNQVHDVQICQNVPQVVEDAVVVLLFEALLVEHVFVEEQTIHLE